MKLLGAVTGVAAVVVALVLQVSLFPHFALPVMGHGIVPNLVLLVVGAASLTRGAAFGMLLGFVGGVALDLAPPADHLAGRWALALVVVAYVASRVRTDSRPSTVAVIGTVAASSFVGTSLFALSGLLLRDPVMSVPDLLQVILVALVWDVLLTPFVLPVMMRMFDAVTPERAAV
ncbi:rod shape-determining protein MreD [Nocardioides sp. LHG3406-4]|uniref:rod shape-determining protein MreD n=1 Tax=Nocardioides sp. LHG3406-4 TaxID=2804575 RepID=UPI003CEF8A6D